MKMLLGKKVGDLHGVGSMGPGSDPLANQPSPRALMGPGHKAIKSYNISLNTNTY